MWLPIVGASVSWGSPFTHICKCVFADIQGASTCACNVTSLHPTHTTDGSVTCSQSLAAEMNILHYPVGDKVFLNELGVLSMIFYLFLTRLEHSKPSHVVLP